MKSTVLITSWMTNEALHEEEEAEEEGQTVGGRREKRNFFFFNLLFRCRNIFNKSLFFVFFNRC